MITVVALTLNNHLRLLQEIYGGQTFQIVTLSIQISELVQIIFELTVPLFVIEKYGYPDVTIENTLPSDTTITEDEESKTASNSWFSNTTGDNSWFTKTRGDKSWFSKKTGNSSHCTTRLELGIDEIMSDKHFRELFSGYLGREFQTEIFLFFDALQYYSQATVEYSCKTFSIEDAKLIIEEFIADDAINKLPLSGIIRKRIMGDFSKLGDVENPIDVANIFEPAIHNLKIQLSFHVYKFNMNV